MESLKKQIQDRIVIMAASTHPGEEEIFAQIQEDLKTYNPLSIIAPRHPDRKDSVLEILKQFKLKVITRSSKEKITKNTDVLLLDTLGEFGLFYRLSKIVCVGGSWSKIGHNFIEAAKLKNLIIFGPNMNNSREVSDDFLNNKAALTAKYAEEIEAIIKAYLIKPQDFTYIQNNAEKAVDEMNKVKAIVMEHIKPYIIEI